MAYYYDIKVLQTCKLQVQTIWDRVPERKPGKNSQLHHYTLSEAWSGVNKADLMAAQGAFGTDFYDRATRTIAGTMLWTEYRPVIKVGPKGAPGSHEIRPIHSAPSLAQSIGTSITIIPAKSASKYETGTTNHRLDMSRNGDHCPTMSSTVLCPDFRRK